MIIVNQDKELMANFDNVEYIWISNPVVNDDDTFKIVAEAPSSNMVMGKYKTEERAKEVLGEIVDNYVRIGTTFKTYSGIEKQTAPIYEMPKE